MRARSRALLALFCLTLLVPACGASPPVSPDPSSLRRLPAGDVVGSTGRYGSHVWRGIPYARPPSGELRWRAPQPLPRWEGTRAALVTGAACPQFASVFAGEGRGAKGVIGDEDCLQLDVYAPRLAPEDVPRAGALLPVMVWIHGGGNSVGRGGFYDGGRLATAQHLVVVTINYRLGPFGWFRHASLRGAGTSPAERSGNFGQLDQIRALEWVRENIAAFGGDPENVTPFGNAAGGSNVRSLLISPLARGLFQRAAIQSSGGFESTTLAQAEHFTDAAEPGLPESSNEILARLLVRDGRAADREAAQALARGMSANEIASYLRSKSQREILAAYVNDADSFGGMYAFPGHFHDGVVMPAEPPRESLARGAYHRVPLLLGTNRDEIKLLQALDPEFVDWRFGLAPERRDPERYDAAAEHHAHGHKACVVDGPAAAMRAVQGPSVYAYRWDWDEEPTVPFFYDGPKVLGAAHGLELAFVFGHFDLGPDTRFIFGRGSRRGREALAAQMMSYWAEFAYTGAPGRGRRGELPEWPAWDSSDAAAPKYMLLDTPDGGGLGMAARTFTSEGVIEELLADPRFREPRQRCSVLVTLVQWGCLTGKQYAAVDACRSLGLDEYPWPEGG